MIRGDITALVGMDPALVTAILDGLFDPHLLLLAERDPDGAVRDLACVAVNAAACDAMGRPREALLGATMSTCLDGAARETLLAPLLDAVSQGVALALDDVLLALDATDPRPRRFDIRAVPIGNGVSLSWRDETAAWEEHRALQEAREALAVSEEHYRLVAENAADLIVRTGPDGRIRWVSPSVREVLGMEPSEVLGRSGLEFVHPDDLAAMRAAIEHVDDGDPGLAKLRFRHADGSHRWMLASTKPVSDARGVVIGRTSTLRDVTLEHEAMEALAASEERFRRMVDGLLDPTVMLTPVIVEGSVVDFVYDYLNPAACAYNARSAEDTVGRRLLELFPAHAEQGVLEVYARVVQSGEPARLDDLAYRDAVAYGDQVRWADVRAFRIAGSLVLTWRDTTVRHEAGAALLESEARYRLLADSAVDVVTVGLPDTTLTWVSPSAQTVMGWEPDAVVGKRVIDLLHPEDRAAWLHRRVTEAPSGAVVYEARFQHADGSYRWMSVATTVVRGPDGTPVARTAIARDISTEHAAREALELSRTDLAEAQRLAHVGSWSWELEGSITWSDELFRMTGLEPSPIAPPQEVARALHPPETAGRLDEAFERAITDGTPFEVTGELLSRTAGTRHIVMRGEPVRDAGGRVVRVRGTMSDVTELTEATRRIQELNEGLEQRVRERTEELETFTYTLSHDLRAPLRWINGFAAMLQRRDGERLDEVSRHYLDEIRTASDRMGTLFEDLLAYSRMGRQSVRAERVDWSGIRSALSGTFGPRLAASGATLTIEEPLAPVVGDPMLLDRAIANLVDNALTYTRDGTPGDVTLQAVRSGDRVRISVADHGPGIAPEHHERIFAPFQRLHDDTVPGSGIGLAIVARAVRLMGGEIRLDSAIGAGSTFSFELPAA